jgi:hypothetical protein
MVRVFLRGSASGAAAGVAVAGGAPGAAATAGGQITSDDLFAAGTGNEGEWGAADVLMYVGVVAFTAAAANSADMAASDSR